MYFSKSRYCEFRKCEKASWLTKYKKEERKIADDRQAVMDTGNEVGDLAMGMFGDFVEVTVLKEDNTPNVQKMIERTREEIEKGTNVICEASFDYNGLYCAVDILKKTKNGYAIYEVKSSSKVKREYVLDVAYQNYVVSKCGINVEGTYLVNLNSDYVRGERLELNQLFAIHDLSEEIQSEAVEENLKRAEEVVECENEPSVDLSENCKKPYDCPYWEYCTKHLPSPSIFDWYKLGLKDKVDLYKRGIVSIEQATSTEFNSNVIRSLQAKGVADKNFMHVDKKGVSKFLSALHYPLYFLDFESMMPAVPIYKGTKCLQQIPFQYSLHYIESEGGEVLHKEFLAESGKDPREEIAKKLVEDIPSSACVLAFNANFEKGRIRDLASCFPAYESALNEIASNVIDLATPFQKGYCYVSAMGNSLSIKSILPALFPSDPELNYKNLDGVNNGSEAMSVYPQIAYMSEEDAKSTREQLLAYCKLDTLAMVKIWQKLTKLCK